ncbi:hypothetical protein WOLCODRAFT_159641 [Wolfiporia cocos MD-104 SS10]|uniref:Uncharacterized protein n=1 Tax=Wolfiporia cocos (strain MD-104) TaxID=742152 RepID=A0A2H3JBL5_WOLCO|nr:hypothetical protein WOLCODRAFT_159641 [Wolfiporia cocos MD-104 SS10]
MLLETEYINPNFVATLFVSQPPPPPRLFIRWLEVVEEPVKPLGSASKPKPKPKPKPTQHPSAAQRHTQMTSPLDSPAYSWMTKLGRQLLHPPSTKPLPPMRTVSSYGRKIISFFELRASWMYLAPETVRVVASYMRNRRGEFSFTR